MSLTEGDMRFLADCALDAARSAGAWITASRPNRVEQKETGHSLASKVVTEIDRASEEIILRILGPSIDRYSLGVLSEEREDDRSRLQQEYFWCVDPLDGTLPYIESIPGYAVSIALVARDGTPVIGVVYDPRLSQWVVAGQGLGLIRGGARWERSSQSRPEVLSVFVDRSFANDPRKSLLEEGLLSISMAMGLSGTNIQMGGGAVMNACWVLDNSPACYLKPPKPQPGGGCLWDFAATACVFREAGLVATDFYGGALDLNRADSTWMNHRGILFATHSDLARRIIAILG